MIQAVQDKAMVNPIFPPEIVALRIQTAEVGVVPSPDAGGSNPDLSAFKISRACRFVASNLLVPILLAWVLTRALHKHLHPLDVRDSVARRNAYGQMTLWLKLPGTHAGIPEPLISCGRIGNASLVFIRLLPNSRAKVGVEFWGQELAQGQEFALPAMDGEIEVTCTVPAFYPARGDPQWDGITASAQQRRCNEYIIAVNGTIRLRGSVTYAEPSRSPVYVGVNPLGGSFVSSAFTGTILRVVQQF
jgi:hypothetical protein